MVKSPNILIHLIEPLEQALVFVSIYQGDPFWYMFLSYSHMALSFSEGSPLVVVSKGNLNEAPSAQSESLFMGPMETATCSNKL